MHGNKNENVDGCARFEPLRLCCCRSLSSCQVCISFPAVHREQCSPDPNPDTRASGHTRKNVICEPSTRRARFCLGEMEKELIRRVTVS